MQRSVCESGKYLMMERLNDVSAQELCLTPSLPEWLSDMLPKNFGKTDAGKIKVRDYAMGRIDKALNAAASYRYAWQGPERK